MELRITIDNNDAEECPESPYTLNAFRDYGNLDSRTKEPMQFDDGGSCLIGCSVPDMLRILADQIEEGGVGEPEEFDTCDRCGGWNDDGEGWNGLCGNCADRAEHDNEED